MEYFNAWLMFFFQCVESHPYIKNTLWVISTFENDTTGGLINKIYVKIKTIPCENYKGVFVYGFLIGYKKTNF